MVQCVQVVGAMQRWLSRRARPPVLGVAMCAFSAWAAACDSQPPSPVPTPQPRPRDAGVVRDSDAAASADGSAALAADADDVDCSLSLRTLLTEPVVVDADRAISLRAADARVQAAWVGLGCGGSTAARGLVAVPLELDATEAQPAPLASASGQECEMVRGPQLVEQQPGTPADLWFLAGERGALHVYRRSLGSMGEKAVQVTADAAARRMLRVTSTSQGVWAGWLESDQRTGVQRIQLLNPGSTVPRTLFEAPSEQRVIDVALGVLGGDSAHARLLVAWAVETSAGSRLWLVTLGGDAPFEGEPEKWANALEQPGGLSFATSPSGGALLWDAHPAGTGELRLLLLDADGRPEGAAERITRRGEHAFSASIAPRHGGYVVGYRSERTVGDARLGLLVLSEQGRNVRHDVLGEVSGLRRAPEVISAPDGRIWMAWADAQSSLGDVRVARLECDD